MGKDMRWIDVDKIIYTKKKVSFGEFEYAIKEQIESLPTVDAVKVVRCKDCKHFKDAHDCYCHAADIDGTPIFVRENDFCSYGERKED